MPRDRDMAEAEAICARWAGRRIGDEVPCKSSLIGRELSVRVRGRAEIVEVVGCAVPRTDKPSKRCRPAYLVKTPGLFPQFDVVDGGRVRNASRTPRETHAGMEWERVGHHFVVGPSHLIRDNSDRGGPLMEGLDVPYTHRAGSSVCCPASAFNGLRLAGMVRDEYETDGEISGSTRRELAKLSTHLRARHAGSESLPVQIGAEDWSGADRITAAADQFCAAYLRGWQQSQEESSVIRAEEQRRKRAAAKSRKRAAAKSRKSESSRAVKALQRDTRRKGSK